MNIGFIGTGSIGNPVAMNQLQAGHSLFIHDIQANAYQNLEDRGAVVCATPTLLASHAEMIFLSLPSDIEVSEVCFSEHGLLKTIKKDCCLCDLTTVSIQLIPQLEAAEESHGFHYLTSPVSEGVDNARKGMLSILLVATRKTMKNVCQCMPALRKKLSIQEIISRLLRQSS